MQRAWTLTTGGAKGQEIRRPRLKCTQMIEEYCPKQLSLEWQEEGPIFETADGYALTGPYWQQI
jgi:hypothetical protein